MALHGGPFGELDPTYGQLAAPVAERMVGADGPIREHYLDDEHTKGLLADHPLTLPRGERRR